MLSGMIQLAERPTEKKNRRNTDAGSSPRCDERIFLPESTSGAESFTMSVQTPCAVACINICTHVKDSKTLAAIPLFGRTKMLHTLVGMGSAALAAALCVFLGVFLFCFVFQRKSLDCS